MIDEILIDNLVVFSAIIYYLFLCLVYLLRAYERDKQELMLGPIFSFLLVPFVALLDIKHSKLRRYWTFDYRISDNHLSGL